jgi:hypothetical protein
MEDVLSKQNYATEFRWRHLADRMNNKRSCAAVVSEPQIKQNSRPMAADRPPMTAVETTHIALSLVTNYDRIFRLSMNNLSHEDDAVIDLSRCVRAPALAVPAALSLGYRLGSFNVR